MTGSPRWAGIADVEHSRWYIERFRRMAAEGADLAGEARLLDALLARGSRVLDAGCGPGRVSGELAARGHHVVGVDVDPELIAAAGEDHPGPRWIVADLADLDLAAHGEADPFDAAILVGNVLAFVAEGSEPQVLASVARHVRADGLVVVGLGLDRGYPIADMDGDAAKAGLVLDQRFATWGSAAVRAGRVLRRQPLPGAHLLLTGRRRSGERGSPHCGDRQTGQTVPEAELLGAAIEHEASSKPGRVELLPVLSSSRDFAIAPSDRTGYRGSDQCTPLGRIGPGDGMAGLLRGAPRDAGEGAGAPQTRKRWAAVGVAVALAAGLSIAFDDSSSNAIAEPLPGDQWRDSVLLDLARMSQGTLDYIGVINDWRNSKAGPGQVGEFATQSMDKYLEARDLLSRRTAFEQAPRVLQDYRDTVQLYIAHTRLAKAGSRLEDRELRREVQLLLGRVRDLADRVYDLGNDQLRPFVSHARDIEGVNYVRAPDVPSFAGSELAPGPPLSPTSAPAGPNRTYEQNRPEQPWASWAEAVGAAGIPAAAAIARSIEEDDVPTLSRVADALTAASDRIHAVPDPQGERALSSRVQLGLLVQAEAVRVAQVARLDPGRRAETLEVARVVALIGQGMWDERLGARELGFPATLLTERPPTAPPPYIEPAIPTAEPADDPSH